MWDATVLWDDENSAHIAENDLTPDEVNEILLDESLDTETSHSSDRPCKFGWTSTGKFILVVWEELNENPRYLLPITAYEVPPPSRQRKPRKRR